MTCDVICYTYRDLIFFCIKYPVETLNLNNKVQTYPVCCSAVIGPVRRLWMRMILHVSSIKFFLHIIQHDRIDPLKIGVPNGKQAWKIIGFNSIFKGGYYKYVISCLA